MFRACRAVRLWALVIFAAAIAVVAPIAVLSISSAPARAERQPSNLEGEWIRDMSLSEMGRWKLEQGAPATLPWVSWDWFFIHGGIAAPYADPRFWEEGGNFAALKVHQRRVRELVRSKALSAWDIELLAPSEKYDLLTGNENFTLTRHVTEYITKVKYKNRKVVEPWEGICDGWSSSSMDFPEPKHSFVLTSASGIEIRFYPDDLKALMSYYAARTIYGKTPTAYGFGPRESTVVDVVDLHLALVGGVGLHKNSFVIDVDPSEGVLNRAVRGYEFGYFDLSDASRTEVSLEKAKVPAAALDSSARWNVGVAMRLRYTRGLRPSHAELDTVGRAFSETSKYEETLSLAYVLELDSNERISGGHWLNGSSPPPHFAWRLGQRPYFLAPRFPWDGQGPFPLKWRDALNAFSRFEPWPSVFSSLLQLMLDRSLE